MSKFNDKSTCDDVLKGKNLDGKHVVITGTTIGSIGFATAQSLYNHNANVTMIGRNDKKLKLSVEKMKKEAPKDCKGKVSTLICDLASQKSALSCAKSLKEKKLQIDLLFLNAGRMSPKYVLTEDNFEFQFAVNHLAHFALTMEILPIINDKGRIVVLSSMANNYAKLEVKDKIDWKLSEKAYSSTSQYCITKLMNILFSNELNKRLKGAGKNIIVNSLHPGIVKTHFQDFMPDEWKVENYKTPKEGASTSVYLAVDEGITKGGMYFSDCKETKYNDLGKDEKLMKKVFDLSEEVTKTKFPFKK